MEDYKKPVAISLNEMSEGVYMASGDDTDDKDETQKKCKFGFTEANPGRDQCQFCSASGGLTNEKGTGEQVYIKEYVGCPEGMPEKKN